MIYLLDTNAVSDLMKADRLVETWLGSLERGDRVVTCTIVRGEVLFGIARLPKGKRRAELEGIGTKILSVFRCEPVPQQAAGFYSELKAIRQRSGQSLDENDMWIAATALALGATLVSRDGHFENIPGLNVVSQK